MPNEESGTSRMAGEPPKPFWLARTTRTIFFFAAVLTVAGIYFAFQVPISVFPETNFPRVVIGVDNGVMPVEQMQVTITKPIEDAVNSVPGLKTVVHGSPTHDPAANRAGRARPNALRLRFARTK